jgi:hypothetical protein
MEYRIEAANRIINSDRTVAEVAIEFKEILPRPRIELDKELLLQRSVYCTDE